MSRSCSGVRHSRLSRRNIRRVRSRRMLAVRDGGGLYQGRAAGRRLDCGNGRLSSTGGKRLLRELQSRHSAALRSIFKSAEGSNCFIGCSDRDVVVENYRPGTLEKMGLGWANLKVRSSQTGVVTVTGYGRSRAARQVHPLTTR